jgi:hypothetical protein
VTNPNGQTLRQCSAALRTRTLPLDAMDSESEPMLEPGKATMRVALPTLNSVRKCSLLSHSPRAQSRCDLPHGEQILSATNDASQQI